MHPRGAYVQMSGRNRIGPRLGWNWTALEHDLAVARGARAGGVEAPRAEAEEQAAAAVLHVGRVRHRRLRNGTARDTARHEITTVGVIRDGKRPVCCTAHAQ